jgi:beta-galactosidase
LVTPVQVYTSGDEAELFVNGVSMGRKLKAQYEYRLRWDSVVYQPGEVKVIAYKNGEKWAVDKVKTTGDASQLKLSPDRTTIKTDGYDLSYITVTVADKEGLQVPKSNNKIQFEVTGAGEIVAVDNGDATDLNSFQSNEYKVFNGLALVIIRSKKGVSGKITIKAKADGLKGSEVTIESK